MFHQIVSGHSSLRIASEIVAKEKKRTRFSALPRTHVLPIYRPPHPSDLNVACILASLQRHLAYARVRFSPPRTSHLKIVQRDMQTGLFLGSCSIVDRGTHHLVMEPSRAWRYRRRDRTQRRGARAQVLGLGLHHARELCQCDGGNGLSRR